MKRLIKLFVGALALKSDSVDKIMSDEQTKLDRLNKVKEKAELDLAQARVEHSDLHKEIKESYVKFDEQSKKEFEDLKKKHLDKLNKLKLDNLHKATQADNTVGDLCMEISRASSYIERLSK